MTARAMMYDEGVFGSRPSAATAGDGAVYFATDTGNLYRSNGSAWTLIGAAGSGVTFAAPTVALGSSAALGSSGEVINSDATIAAFDTTVPTTQAFGDAAAVGTAAFAARRDHKHAMPAMPVTSLAKSGGSALTGAVTLSEGSGITITPSGNDLSIASTGGGGTPVDGWIASSDTWTYASGSGGGLATFTIASVDRTVQLAVGTRIKLTQTTDKYFVVTAVAFSTNTTVTIMAGTDYTLANASITSPFYSYASNPQGYPKWFNWAVAATGYSGTPTTTGRFQVNGGFCSIYLTIDGTSNSTSFGFSLPVAVCAQGGPPLIGDAYDNNATLLAPSMAQLSGGSTTVALRKTWMSATTTWTASAGKGIYITGVYAV